MKKYFSYDDEVGFELWDTEEEAAADADMRIQEYRDNAADYGWDEIAGNVCWGELTEQSVMVSLDYKVEFEGEMVEAVDYQLKPIEDNKQ